MFAEDLDHHFIWPYNDTCAYCRGYDVVGEDHGTTLVLEETMVLIIMWVMTPVPNPITNERALPVNSISIVTELFEIAFIIITEIIISKERSKRPVEIKQDVG
jgi:hypothetical protein